MNHPTSERAAEGDGDRLPSIWRNRDFRAVLIGQGISNLGDAINATVLPLLVLSVTHSGAQMGAVATLQALTALLAGPVAGALADRYDRRRVLATTSLALALLTALIPLAAAVRIPVLPVIYLVAAPLSAGEALFGAAYAAALPRLVGRDELARANSSFEALESAAWIAGPGLAGVLVARFGAPLALLADAASFLAAALAVSRVRRSLQALEPAMPERVWLQIREGFTFIVGHRLLRTLVIFWWSIRVVGAPLVAALAFDITVDRKMPASAVGLAVSAYAAGSLVGTLLGGRVAARPEPLMLLAGAGMGAALGVLGVAGAYPVVLGAACLFGLGEGFVLVIYLTARARATPDTLLGRVAGTASTVGTGLTSVGMMGAGMLLDHAGGAVTLAVMGAVLLVVSLLLALSRSLRGLSIT